MNSKVELTSGTPNNKTVAPQVYQLVYKTFFGGIGKKREIDHISGYEDDNHVSNLQSSSKEQNRSKRYPDRDPSAKKPSDAIVRHTRHQCDNFETSWVDVSHTPLGNFPRHEMSISGNFRRKDNHELLDFCYVYNDSRYLYLRLYESTSKNNAFRVNTLMVSCFLIPTHEGLFQDLSPFQYRPGMTADDFRGNTVWSKDYIIDHVEPTRTNNAVWNLRILPARLNSGAKSGIKVRAELIGADEVKRFNTTAEANRGLRASIKRVSYISN